MFVCLFEGRNRLSAFHLSSTPVEYYLAIEARLSFIIIIIMSSFAILLNKLVFLYLTMPIDLTSELADAGRQRRRGEREG